MRTVKATAAQRALYQQLQAASPAYAALQRTAAAFYANGASFPSNHVYRQWLAAGKRWRQQYIGAGFFITQTGLRIVTGGTVNRMY